MSPELLDILWKAAIGLAAGLILYAIKDRRKSKIENELAEDTLAPRSKKVGIEALESQILAMSGAWDQERASKDRQIKDLEKRCAGAEEKLEEANRTIAGLRERAEAMQTQLSEFKRQIERLTALVEPREI